MKQNLKEEIHLQKMIIEELKKTVAIQKEQINQHKCSKEFKKKVILSFLSLIILTPITWILLFTQSLPAGWWSMYPIHISVYIIVGICTIIVAPMTFWCYILFKKIWRW